MKTLVAALLLSTVAATHAMADKPLSVGSVVATRLSHAVVCASAAGVVEVRKQHGYAKGCLPTTTDQYGVVVDIDRKAGVMKIQLGDSGQGPQAFTTVSGWYEEP